MQRFDKHCHPGQCDKHRLECILRMQRFDNDQLPRHNGAMASDRKGFKLELLNRRICRHMHRRYDKQRRRLRKGVHLTKADPIGSAFCLLCKEILRVRGVIFCKNTHYSNPKSCRAGQHLYLHKSCFHTKMQHSHTGLS